MRFARDSLSPMDEDPHCLNQAFGKVIRHMRIEAGLSQEELGYRSNLHRTYISQLERGLKSPSLNAIEALAEALQCAPHELVRAAEKKAT